jgi:polar amino acid transport system substrate-binding protein
MSISRKILSALAFAAGALFASGAYAQSCEPAKVAQKYPSLAGKTIKIGVDPESPPWVIRDKTDFNKMAGADADLAREVFACAGVKTEFFSGAWSSLLPALSAGQINVMWDTLYYTPERARQMDFVVYLQAGTGALVAAGNPKKIDGPDKMCGTTAAAGVGTVEIALIQEQDAKCRAAGKPAITIATFPDVAGGARLIANHRADVMLYNLALIDALARQNPTQYVRGFEVLNGKVVGVGVKKGDKELAAAISDGLKAMQANGTEKKLLVQYGIDPTLQAPVAVLTN